MMKLNFEKKVHYGFMVLLIMALLGILGFIICLLNQSNKQSLPDSGYQYYHDQRLELNQDAVLRINTDGTYLLLVEDNEIMPDYSPIYFVNTESFILLHDYILVSPYTATQKYIESNSTFVSEKGKINRYVNGEKVESGLDGFLFNGIDTYITLEKTTIEFMDKTITLAPFSFVEVISNESLRVYNYRKEEMLMIPLTSKTKDIILVDEKRSYRLDLYYDALNAAQGQEILLFTSPKNLKEEK